MRASTSAAAGLPTTADDAPSSSSSSRPADALGAVLGYINESTKFIVSAIAFATLVTFPNVQTCWCILGSVVGAVRSRTRAVDPAPETA